MQLLLTEAAFIHERPPPFPTPSPPSPRPVSVYLLSALYSSHPERKAGVFDTMRMCASASADSGVPLTIMKASSFAGRVGAWASSTEQANDSSGGRGPRAEPGTLAGDRGNLTPCKPGKKKDPV